MILRWIYSKEFLNRTHIALIISRGSEGENSKCNFINIWLLVFENYIFICKRKLKFANRHWK